MASLVLKYLNSGPLKLVIVAVCAWLGLFTLFISSGFFLRGHDFQHPVGIIPSGVVEKRVFSVAALKSFSLSTENKRTLYSLDPSSHLDISIDTTSPGGPKINRGAPPSYSRNSTISRLLVSAHPTSPWDTFGLNPADAVELNNLVYSANRWQNYLTIYVWPGEKTPERQVIRLSLSDKFAHGNEFATIIRTRNPHSSDSWLVILDGHPSASTRALPVQRTLAWFLWPVLFHHSVSMAGVFLLWVCVMTSGYACITMLVAQWAIRSTGPESREERRGRGAALRWEEEGWAIMNAVGESTATHRSEEDDPLLKDCV
ncbi:hypothetical protein RhiJN_17902 [Ceratobasidium sp. AG-Ba]|nr:hypothetical protein RhiJN_17902 [Ceratobasidium sp. AG-Ba]